MPGVKNLINLSACPINAANLTALLTYYLTFKRWPALDGFRRPLFAYGKTIHDNCERRAHFDAGQYVEMWGDDAHRSGRLPLQDGLQGAGHLPELPHRPLERGDQLAHRLRSPVHRLRRAGLLGQDDALLQAPARRCPASPPGPSVDTVGAWLTVGAAAAFAGHGVVKGIQNSGKKHENGAGPPADKSPAGKAGGPS